jgi:DNA-binding Lrp family transcriptional regulator
MNMQDFDVNHQSDANAFNLPGQRKPRTMSRPAPCWRTGRVNLDELDLKIVEILRSSPKASNRHVARLAGVSDLTAANRIRRLIQRGDINIVGRSNLNLLGFDTTAHVDVYVRAGWVGEVARNLVALPRVNVVDIVAGPPHIMVVFLAKESTDVLAVLENDIGTIDGIERLEVTVTTDTIKLLSGYARV